MYLSNRLTFSIFSILLVAMCAFVATPAMAITTVTAQATERINSDNTVDAEVQGKRVVTIKYSENADPKPTKATFTTDGTAALDDGVVFAEVNASTYTLTFLGPADGATDASISDIKLPGYTVMSGSDLNSDSDSLVADPVVTPAARNFVVEANTLAGRGYAIIATFTNRGTAAFIESTTGANVDVSVVTEGSYPTLPTNVDDLVRRDWDDHFNAASTTGTNDDRMPDLWAHFQQGHRGTLDLTVVKGDAAPIDGTFTTTDDGATDRVGDANARTVVINEVMWGRDESQVGSTAYTREQWIEIYNTKTTPVPFENIWFTLSNAHPAPTNESTDRLSTNPNFTTVWDITGKGQDGHPGADDGSGRKEFIAMARTNHGDGYNAGHWASEGDLYLPNYRGTPGRANAFAGLPGARTAPGKDTPAKGTFVINEIGNMDDDTNDWIEIKNITGSAQSLKNWALSLVTAFNNEAELYRFPDKSIPAGGVFLLVNKGPNDTNLARGFNMNVAAIDQDFGIDNNISYLIVGSNKLAIPNDNNWLLILRNGNPWNVKDGRSVYNSGWRVQDVAGAARIEKKDLNAASPAREKKDNGAGGGDIWQTTHFPLNGHNLGGDKILRHDRNLSSNVWARNTGKQGYERHAFNQAGFTGIGYDRNVADNNANGGTPGYDNGVAKGKLGDISDGGLIISELMLTTDNGRYPQWIELTNTSKTQGIHFASDGSDPRTGWQIKFENHNSGTWQSKNRPLTVTINLTDWFHYIPPQQSVLIAAFIGSYSNNIPDNRLVSVTTTKRSEFKMEGRRDSFLNAEGGFWIQIVDGDGNVADEVGNLDGVASNPRAGIGIDAPFGWDWPAAMTADDTRTSLIRIKNDDGTPRTGVPTRDDPDTEDVDESDETGSVVPMGTIPGMRRVTNAWVHASDLDFVDVVRSQETWFGASTDKGTPLYVPGQALPVSLSFFRPTLEDGAIVIRWTTESELDNAGFNIYRSDTRDGEFTQVNENMIQGNGTTGERSTYKWVDTTAKPDAVYYYQIEDVSFAGERNMLATTKLKGLISAKGKLTTTWGDIKGTSQ